MSCLSIGSGDVPRLLMGINTKGHRELWKEFINDTPPYYNSFASPIDALRTGAILEDRYMKYMGDDYYSQVKVRSEEMSVFNASLDFAKIEAGIVTEFKELKTIWFTDFIDVISESPTEVIKKKFKNNYNQVQEQLFCAGLDKATLVFLSVESYDDEINMRRIIKEKDTVEFVIERDEQVIEKLKERGKPFQVVKNHFNAH